MKLRDDVDATTLAIARPATPIYMKMTRPATIIGADYFRLRASTPAGLFATARRSAVVASRRRAAAMIMPPAFPLTIAQPFLDVTSARDDAMKILHAC